MTDDADTARQLNAFLAQVERRAYRIAEIATRNPDEALDIVQDAMLKLVQKYARRNPDEWPPLFYRILNNRINDWHRRSERSGTGDRPSRNLANIGSCVLCSAAHFIVAPSRAQHTQDPRAK
ncbi:MAG: hypothetical protein KKE76_02465 [Gammaproteobacteria bacterium]|nr:hypothetical protein [Gammaproteobacteria bacterium]